MPFLDQLGETGANDDVAQDWKNVIHSSVGWRQQYSGINVVNSLSVFYGLSIINIGRYHYDVFEEEESI